MLLLNGMEFRHKYDRNVTIKIVDIQVKISVAYATTRVKFTQSDDGHNKILTATLVNFRKMLAWNKN